jgi:sulfite exporter TauE/SafE
MIRLALLVVSTHDGALTTWLYGVGLLLAILASSARSSHGKHLLRLRLERVLAHSSLGAAERR